MGHDAAAYRRLMTPLFRHWEHIADEILQPIPHLPRHPVSLAQFGIRALCAGSIPNSPLFPPPSSLRPLCRHGRPLAALPRRPRFRCHRRRPWPYGPCRRLALPSRRRPAITSSLVACLRDAGGQLECGATVRSLADLPPARALLLDISPWQFLRLAGDRLPSRYRSAIGRFQHGPAVFKVDYALDAPVPWRDDVCLRAGTLHLGGSAEEIAASEQAIAHGRIPDRPFVLAAQHTLFDSTRAPAGSILSGPTATSPPARTST